MQSIRTFSLVALLEDIPEYNLVRGQIGTVVESIGPDSYDVEFADRCGQILATLSVAAASLLELHLSRAEVACS